MLYTIADIAIVTSICTGWLALVLSIAYERKRKSPPFNINKYHYMRLNDGYMCPKNTEDL